MNLTYFVDKIVTLHLDEKPQLAGTFVEVDLTS